MWPSYGNIIKYYQILPSITAKLLYITVPVCTFVACLFQSYTSDVKGRKRRTHPHRQRINVLNRKCDFPPPTHPARDVKVVRPIYGVELFDGETARFEVEISEDDVHGQWKLNGDVLSPSSVRVAAGGFPSQILSCCRDFVVTSVSVGTGCGHHRGRRQTHADPVQLQSLHDRRGGILCCQRQVFCQPEGQRWTSPTLLAKPFQIFWSL